MDFERAEEAAIGFLERVEALEIELARLLRIHAAAYAGLEVLEDMILLEREIELVAVEDLEDEHFVDGDRGASTWILRGTSRDGERLDINGCDLWTFRGDLVVRKDSYWKRRTP